MATALVKGSVAWKIRSGSGLAASAVESVAGVNDDGIPQIWRRKLRSGARVSWACIRVGGFSRSFERDGRRYAIGFVEAGDRDASSLGVAGKRATPIDTIGGNVVSGTALFLSEIDDETLREY